MKKLVILNMIQLAIILILGGLFAAEKAAEKAAAAAAAEVKAAATTPAAAQTVETIAAAAPAVPADTAATGAATFEIMEILTESAPDKYIYLDTGEKCVLFNDDSYALYNPDTNLYIFQPANLIDWDYTVNDMQQLENIIKSYSVGTYNHDIELNLQ